MILASPDLLAIEPLACSASFSNVLGGPHFPSPLQQCACATAAVCIFQRLHGFCDRCAVLSLRKQAQRSPEPSLCSDPFPRE